MKFAQLLHDERGQAEAVQLQVTLIISLMIAVIVVYQLFVAGVGPTDNAGRYIEDNELENNWEPNPNYSADALTAWNNVRNLAWAGIGLMAVAIIVLAASVILSIVRGGLGGGRGV